MSWALGGLPGPFRGFLWNNWGAIGIVDLFITGNSQFSNIEIDDIATVVPEPGTSALLSLGVVGIVAMWRKSRTSFPVPGTWQTIWI